MRRDGNAVRTARCLWLVMCAGVLAGWACQREEPPPPSAVEREVEPAASGPAAADARDDPDAPRTLPESNDVAGWIKTRPVRVLSPDELGSEPIEAWLIETARSYRLARASICLYSGPAEAEVILFETPVPEDAFGLFSVLTRHAGQQVRSQDGMIIERRQAGATFTVAGWQGHTCLLLRAAGCDGDEKRRSADQLARRILFGVPSADAPFVMRAIPPSFLQEGKVWMVRRAGALKATALPLMEQLAKSGLEEVLGLTGAETLWIAALGKRLAGPAPAAGAPDTRPAGPPVLAHLIWVVQYARDDDARLAFDRYGQRLSASATQLDRQTVVREPRGQYLAGSWTAGAEAAEPMLPALMDLLPAAESPAANRNASPGDGIAASPRTARKHLSSGGSTPHGGP